MINATTTYTLAEIAQAFDTDQLTAISRLTTINKVFIDRGMHSPARVNSNGTVTLENALVRSLNRLAEMLDD